jgi:acyl carrier protein
MSTSITIEEQIVEILADVLDEPAAALTEEPTLAAHQWDSLASLEALAQLESRFGVNLDLSRFHAAHTVAELVELVRTEAAR